MQSEPFIAIICRQGPRHRIALMFLVNYKKCMREEAIRASNHDICFADSKLQRSFVIKHSVVFLKLESDCFSYIQVDFSDFSSGRSLTCLGRM